MRFLIFVLLAACTSGTEPTRKKTGSTEDSTPTGVTTGTPTDTGLTTTGTTEPPEPFDCTTIPSAPLGTTEISAARGSYDLIMDDQGYVYGWDVGGLRKADYYGNSSLVTPAADNLQGLAWLPDGDLAASEINTEAILRIDVTTGGVSLIASDINAYGLKLGPDGKLWAGTDDAAGGGKLVRVDPVTGERELLISDDRFNVRSIDFSPDYTRLYMGTYLGDGRFWVLDLDANYDPIGDATVFHPSVGTGTEHDAVGVDVCGNVWVVDYGTLTLYRLAPDGQKEVFTEFSDGHYGHGITWGSGIGGFKDTAIYLPEPWYGNTVIEIEIGVPSRSWTP